MPSGAKALSAWSLFVLQPWPFAFYFAITGSSHSSACSSALSLGFCSWMWLLACLFCHCGSAPAAFCHCWPPLRPGLTILSTPLSTLFSCRVSGVSQHQCQETGQRGAPCAYEMVSPFVSEHSRPFFWPLSLGGCVGLGLALGPHGLLLVWLLCTASKLVPFKDHCPRHGAVLN